MYWRPWRWTREQWLGAWVAAAISASIAEIGFVNNAPLITVAGLSGVPLAWLVAGRYAERVLAGRSFVVDGLGVGFRTGSLALSLWFVATAVLTLLFNPESLQNRLGQVAFAAFGVPVYGSIFGLPFALVGGITGALALRAIRRFGDAGLVALAMISVGLVIGGVVEVLVWLMG